MERTTPTISRGERLIRQKRDKYCRIPLKSKLIFYEKVIHQHCDLIQVAQRLGIKYSTAKTLIRNYKGLPEEKNTEMLKKIIKEFEDESRPLNRCSYQIIEDFSQSQIGHVKSDSDKHETGLEHARVEIICNFPPNQIEQ